MTDAVDGWVDVASVDDFESTDRKLLTLDETTQIGLFKVRATFRAVSAWCSHQRMSLMEGPVDEDSGEIMCPFHGARFDLETGRQLCMPALRPIPVYELKVEAGRIYVRP